MTSQEILTNAIEKAIAGGWDCFGTDLEKWDWHIGEGRIYPLFMYHTPNESVGLITYTSPNYDAYRIIFNHDFAKALWGEDEAGVEDLYSPKHNELSGSYWPEMWEYRLQQMVIADDPIHYLGSNI